MNAIQAMKRGDRLDIRCFESEGKVIIEIEDSGLGMSDEMVKHIFEPFRSSRRDGFGLGLYSCRQIVHDCQGTITVTSEVGIGTTFRVELPIS